MRPALFLVTASCQRDKNRNVIINTIKPVKYCQNLKETPEKTPNEYGWFLRPVDDENGLI